MRLAIADPPYLGRAARWYGDGRGSGRKQVRGRVVWKPDYHPEAADWDKPERHRELVRELAAAYEGFAVAAHVSSLPVYVDELEACGVPYRVAVWAKTNSTPGGARVMHCWEPVFVRVPDDRRRLHAGIAVRDWMCGPTLPVGFVGAKPPAWTHWVLELLGYRDGDEVVDLFTGSGAVSRAVHTPLIEARIKRIREGAPARDEERAAVDEVMPPSLFNLLGEES